jgi:tetratricopeptide (TPR) repeat protein
LSYFENQDWEEAILSYTKAISLETQLVNDLKIGTENLSFYYNNRGLAKYHLSQFDDAIEDFNDAINKNYQNSENYFNRGNVRLHQENFELAHEDYDKAIMLDPSNAKLFHAKGLAF